MLIGYARVSTFNQNLIGQLNQLIDCDRIFQEKASGAKEDREQLKEMLKYVKEGDTVVVTKLDRIARSTKHLLSIVEQLERKKVIFKVLNINFDTSTPTGRLMLTMLGAIATFEREMMLERQRDGIEAAKKEGKYKGRPSQVDAAMLLEKSKERKIRSKAQLARELDLPVFTVRRLLKGVKVYKPTNKRPKVGAIKVKRRVKK